jgi:SSS family solute:Na+ symporter
VAALLGDKLYAVWQRRSRRATAAGARPCQAGAPTLGNAPGLGRRRRRRISSLAGQNSTVLVTLAGAEARQATACCAGAPRPAGRELKPAPAGNVLDGAVRATGQAHVLYLLRPAGRRQRRSCGPTTPSPDPGPPRQPGAGRRGSRHRQRSASGWANGLLWARATRRLTAAQHLAYTELVTGKRLLKTLDWFVIVVYLAGMLGIGWYCYVREKRNSTADFFVGGRSIPFWAAGISLYAANTSSISYIAIPAKAFETNWQYMTNNLIAVIALTFVAVAIVPLLRRLNLMSVFQYLEIRFHPAIRMLASLICILVQIGSRMSVILLLPSLAIATITGIDVTWSILHDGRLHHHLHGDGRHEGGGLDRLRAAVREDGRRAVRDRLHHLEAGRRRDRIRRTSRRPRAKPACSISAGT